MKKTEGLRQSDDPIKRVAQVLYDLLPYDWKDNSAFTESVKRGLEGNYQAAIDLLHDVIGCEPGAYPAYHLTGYWHGCLGDFKQEIEFYKKAIKQNPGYPQVYYDLGAAYAMLDKEKKAFAAFKQSVPLAQDFAVADYWFNFSFDRLGRYPQSGKVERDLLKCRALSQVSCLLGNAFVEHRLYSSARHAFKRAIQAHPDNAEAYYQLGELHIRKLRNPQRAAKYLAKAEQLFLGQGDLHRVALAHQLSHLKDDISDKGGAAENWLKEGLRLQMMGRYQSAVDAYKIAIAFKPKYLEAFYNMGIAYGCLADERVAANSDKPEEIERAIWAFKDSLRIKPDFIHAYIGIGASYIKSARFNEAISTLQSAIQFEPQDATIYYYLGMASRMSGDHAEAVEKLKKAVAIDPSAEQVHYYLGLVYLDLRQYENARDSFREAVRVKPDFADGHYMLGDMFSNILIDPEKAILHLRKAEKLYLKLEDYDQSARVRQRLSHFPE
jgi:tetratricopeptide (TPR) repeat protein